MNEALKAHQKRLVGHRILQIAATLLSGRPEHLGRGTSPRPQPPSLTPPTASRQTMPRLVRATAPPALVPPSP